MVRIGKVEREDVARECGVSEKRMQSVIRMLVENEVFIPIFQDGKRLNAVYFVNPWFITRGDWKYVKELRDGFEYVRECDRDKIEKDYNVKIPCTFIDKNNVRHTLVTDTSVESH